MRRIICIFVAAASCSLVAAPLPGSLTPTTFEFEDSYQFESKVLHLEFTNISDHALDVSRIESSRSNVEVEYSLSHIEPREVFHVTAKISSLDRAGKSTYHFDIYTGNKDLPDTRFSARGFVDWMIDPKSVEIDLGVVQANVGKVLDVTVASRSGEDVRLVDIETAGKFTKTEILDHGRKIRFTVEKNLDWGLISDRITFRTNNKAQTRVQYVVSADVRGEVVPSSNPLDIGMVRANMGFSARLTLEGPSGKKLRVGKLSLLGTEIATDVAACVPKMDSCAIIQLHLPPQPETTKKIQGVLKIELPEYRRTLPIPVSVFIVKTDSVVRNLNEEVAKAEEMPSSISLIMKGETIAPTEMPRPSGAGPLLTWQVGNEWGVYGYEIYRGESEHGVFKRVNDSIVKTLTGSSPKVGSIYHWRDSTATSGATYWYYIQIVYSSGRKQALSGPQMIRSK